MDSMTILFAALLAHPFITIAGLVVAVLGWVALTERHLPPPA